MNTIYFLIGTLFGFALWATWLFAVASKLNRKRNADLADMNRQMLSEMTEANRLRHVQITALRDLANAMRGE